MQIFGGAHKETTTDRVVSPKLIELFPSASYHAVIVQVVPYVGVPTRFIVAPEAVNVETVPELTTQCILLATPSSGPKEAATVTSDHRKHGHGRRGKARAIRH